jgi:hypothetical protein
MYLNHIAIGTDQTHLMDTSTRPCKLLKHRIRDTKISASELAGLPDNAILDRRGSYWMVLHGEKNKRPFDVNNHLLAIRVGANGKIL